MTYHPPGFFDSLGRANILLQTKNFLLGQMELIMVSNIFYSQIPSLLATCIHRTTLVSIQMADLKCLISTKASSQLFFIFKSLYSALPAFFLSQLVSFSRASSQTLIGTTWGNESARRQIG